MDGRTVKILVASLLGIGGAVVGSMTGIIDPISAGTVALDSATELYDLIMESIEGEE